MATSLKWTINPLNNNKFTITLNLFMMKNITRFHEHLNYRYVVSKKQVLFLFVFYISMLGFAQSVGDTFVDNFITYQITSISPNEVQTSDYDMAGGTVVNIPSTVDYNAINFTVTKINASSFTNNQLTKVTMPNTIITIAAAAFFNNQLTSVVIPSNVTLIQAQAFAGNNSLSCVVSEANTPPTIFDGNGDSFGTRSNINVVVPTGTSTAYANANWTGFQSLTEGLSINDTFVTDYITYKVTSTSPATVEAIDYDTSGGTVVDIPETVTSSCSGEYTVTEIGISAFGQKQLTSITIPNGITNIKHHAFNINQLTSVIIPESVTNIDYLAFSNNPINTVVSLSATPPNLNITTVNDVFHNSNRSNIDLVIINNATDEYVTDPGALWTGFKMVFEATSPTTVEVSHYNPANGTDVIIPATVSAGSNVFDVVKIDDSAFENIGLTSVSIPNSVTEIGISAFNTNNLTNVTIPDSVTLIGTTAFATNPITNLSLGANVTDIGIGAFVDNALSDVTIPGNVTFIGLLAFGNNPLTDVYTESLVPPTITTGTNDTFAFNRSNIHLHIPPGTMGVYVTDPGALWTGFNPVTEDVLSIDDYELANAIKIITSEDSIQVISNNNAQLNNYEVYALTGAKVTEGNSYDISTETWAKGIYILKLDFDRGSVTKKVIIN